MKHIRTRRLSMPAALAALAGAVIAFAGVLPAALGTVLYFSRRQAGVLPAALAQAPKPVVLRFVSDFPPPPHPAGLAMKHFAERLPQVIPGSEARLYYAGALYTIPEAFEAMRQGNLEMTWMQMGKAAPVDPYMMAVVGPGILTTVGAVDALEKTKTYRFLVERLEKQQLIKVFGAGHMSFGMGVGGKRRYLKPEDFVGRKVRSMGPAENPVLEAWKASPVVMAFGEVPSALESGVIDGLMTSIGGWLSGLECASRRRSTPPAAPACSPATTIW